MLYAVGDIMLERDLITLMDRNGSSYPFDALRELLDGADVTIGNLEGTFTDRGVQADKFYTFRTPTRHVAGLAQAGFDVVSLGNNHAMDYGAQGLEDTIATLDNAGLLHSGAGLDAAAARRPAFLDVNGLRIAFLSYNAAALSEAFPAGPATPGVAVAEVAAIQQDVAAALEDADVVVVSLHAGSEYTDQPTSEQMTLSRAAIDAGAAVVLGHHPHVLQAWEQYGGGYIFYSLGNFVFDLDFDDLETLGVRPFQSLIVRLELTVEGVAGVETRSVFIDPAENRPLPASREQEQQIEARLEQLNLALE
jgi:poly-gamma-glutamate synthesis protein (capsule biosynthesis protein)